MYRRRLREKYTDEQLSRIYRKPHNHRHWIDHRYRVEATIGLGKVLFGEDSGRLVDLSCGDAAIAFGIARNMPLASTKMWLSDFAFHPDYNDHGPIEETLGRAPLADMFICSETIEHLDDPDTVLKMIRDRSKSLLLSTPLGEESTHNPEHYWGWDEVEVGKMLLQAGWSTKFYNELHMPGYEYTYQIWGCM